MVFCDGKNNGLELCKDLGWCAVSCSGYLAATTYHTRLVRLFLGVHCCMISNKDSVVNKVEPILAVMEVV